MICSFSILILMKLEPLQNKIIMYNIVLYLFYTYYNDMFYEIKKKKKLYIKYFIFKPGILKYNISIYIIKKYMYRKGEYLDEILSWMYHFF